MVSGEVRERRIVGVQMELLLSPFLEVSFTVASVCGLMSPALSGASFHLHVGCMWRELAAEAAQGTDWWDGF